MRVVTRILIALALSSAVAAAPAAAQTAADRDVPAGLTKTLRSKNFLAHYTTSGPNRVPVAAVRLFLRAAEDGLVRLVRDRGFNMPRRDRDGLVDIYVHDELGEGNVAQAGADDDRAGAPSSGYLEVDKDERDRGTLVHELAHVIQFGYGMGTEGDWFTEGTATWASATLYGARTTDANFATPISAPLRCEPISRCPGDGPYGQWRFWESLAETYGPLFVSEVLERDGQLVRRGGGDPSVTALRQVLAARGSTLAQALQQYVERSARADWTHPKLRALESIALRDALPGEEDTNPIEGPTLATRVTLKPLSGLYVRLLDGSAAVVCTPASLTVTARLPEGSESVPSLLIRVLGSETSVPMTPTPGVGYTAAIPWAVGAGPGCRADAYVLVTNPKAVGTLTIPISAVVGAPLPPPAPPA